MAPNGEMRNGDFFAQKLTKIDENAVSPLPLLVWIRSLHLYWMSERMTV